MSGRGIRTGKAYPMPRLSERASGVGAAQAVQVPAPVLPSDIFDPNAVPWAWAGRGLKQEAVDKQYGLLVDDCRGQKS